MSRRRPSSRARGILAVVLVTLGVAPTLFVVNKALAQDDEEPEERSAQVASPNVAAKRRAVLGAIRLLCIQVMVPPSHAWLPKGTPLSTR